jgi:High potential iron-sulfur protein
MDRSSENQSRKDALRTLIVLPALAGALALTATAADAADNKAQFKYEDKPDPKTGHKCSMCQLFKPPHSCSVVTGVISPNGWCTAWVKKS